MNFFRKRYKVLSSCLTIVAGDHYRCTNRDAKEQTYTVCAEQFYIHEGYNPNRGGRHRHRHDNDIALLQLPKDVEFSCGVKPICLPREEPSTEYDCYATGWGITSNPKIISSKEGAF